MAFSLAACAFAQGLVPPPGRNGSRACPCLEDHQCGPASLAMVLNHLGDPHAGDISRALYRESLRGTLRPLIWRSIPAAGAIRAAFCGAAQDVADAVNAGIPPLVMVNRELRECA